MASGVFSGGGRVVEIENLPGDPDNVNRDDLVFAAGSMHLVTVTVGQSFSVDPRSCMVRVSLQQTQTIDGGTCRFTAATAASPGRSQDEASRADIRIAAAPWNNRRASSSPAL
jgi:hypothetical protein